MGGCGCPWMRSSRQLWAGFLLESLSVSRNCIPLMPFDILLCLFPALPTTPSHGGPASVLWVLLERNGFLRILHNWSIWVLIHYSPFFCERGHCQLVQFCSVWLWRRNNAGKVSLTCFRASKFMFFFLQGNIELSPQEGQTFTKSLLSLSGQISTFQVLPYMSKKRWAQYVGFCWFHRQY